MKCLRRLVVLGAVVVAAGVPLTAQTDPGVRAGASAGGPISGLTSAQLALFNAAKAAFQEVDSVTGTEPGAAGKGLGPRFNMNSCAGCHAQPAVGGTSPFTNPQIGVATEFGAVNTVPSFISATGPVREARFIRNPDGTPDGGVHDLFSIAHRGDADGCTIAQTDFAPQISAGNVIFRIPTPVFGGGLIEAIADSTIIANQTSNAAVKQSLGISGHPNFSGNDGTITRFGWKAQNKSLLIFGGEAYNVEQGVTNEAFPDPRETQPGCGLLGHPEDNSLAGNSDVTNFGLFMRMLAPPTPAPATASTNNGRNLFNQIGCALCHTPTLPTNINSIAALSQTSANLLSDLLVHNMGPGLADQVTQGNATGDEFRTAPLWGLGQRIFFLHDGRTRDLLVAIRAHGSNGNAQFRPSEANAVINTFNNSLTTSQRQDILNYLRSL
ncbi:MAG: thiol oxidoreductase [Acidobacteriia bacterium]|nr:thiol oxidoreductase [Terriglobia bacterium]